MSDKRKFTSTQNDELRKPLDPNNIKKRKQAGVWVDYVEGWQVIDEANKVFDFDGWDRETIYNKEVLREKVKIGDNKIEGWEVGYKAKVRITVGGIIREGTGYGSGAMRKLSDAIESASKEAETDAMKRAMMTFGYRFGLALYDKEKRNVREEETPEPKVDKIITEPKTKEPFKRVDRKRLIPVPIKRDGSGSDWKAYGETVIQVIDIIESAEEYIAFKIANKAALEKLMNEDKEVIEQIKEVANRKIVANGWKIKNGQSNA